VAEKRVRCCQVDPHRVVVRALDPRSGVARIGLAQVAQRRHDYEGALSLLRETIEVDPGTSGPVAYAAIGRLELRRRDFEAAREAFQAALEVEAGEDRLTMSLNGSRAIPFAAVDRDTFQFRRLLVRFRRDDTGQVAALEFSNPVMRRVPFLRRDAGADLR